MLIQHVRQAYVTGGSVPHHGSVIRASIRIKVKCSLQVLV